MSVIVHLLGAVVFAGLREYASRLVHCTCCHRPLVYLHGHAACVAYGCPFYGVNQAECCSGELAENCPAMADQLPQPAAAKALLKHPFASAQERDKH